MGNHVVFIAVGSNIGDAEMHCRDGIKAVCAIDRTMLTGISNFYDTEPVGYTDQGRFVNAAIRVVTDLEPIALFGKLKDIEKAVGRKESGVRFGPRVLDLDIVLFDDRIVDTDELIIPHPRMHERRFVLKPICDIDADVIHPVLKRSVGTLLHHLSNALHQDVIRL